LDAYFGFYAEIRFIFIKNRAETGIPAL